MNSCGRCSDFSYVFSRNLDPRLKTRAILQTPVCIHYHYVTPPVAPPPPAFDTVRAEDAQASPWTFLYHAQFSWQFFVGIIFYRGIFLVGIPVIIFYRGSFPRRYLSLIAIPRMDMAFAFNPEPSLGAQLWGRMLFRLQVGGNTDIMLVYRHFCYARSERVCIRTPRPLRAVSGPSTPPRRGRSGCSQAIRSPGAYYYYYYCYYTHHYQTYYSTHYYQ